MDHPGMHTGIESENGYNERSCHRLNVYSNLIVSAWEGEKLIGIASSMTDFHYACYFSDLAVDKNYQNSRIGKQLQIITQEQPGPKCKLIVIAAPAANSYYEHPGLTNQQRCWVL